MTENHVGGPYSMFSSESSYSYQIGFHGDVQDDNINEPVLLREVLNGLQCTEGEREIVTVKCMLAIW